MTEPLDETSEGSISLLALSKREELLKGKTVVVIGPGLTSHPETQEFVRDFVGICPVQLVIDADGLNAFAGRVEDLQPDETESWWTDLEALRVLTPHPGEMGRLLGIDTGEVQHSRIRMALRAATQSLCTVVLKGHRTVIASPHGYVWINTTGNAGMAKGGSGDVLSGIIAGLLAQLEHFPGMLGWTANVDADHIGRPEMQGIFRKVAMETPTAAEIQALAREYGKTKDPVLKKTIESKMQEKLKQMFVLLGSLNVARAAYLHGLAGDIAASLYGQQSMIATDIINCLGEAFAVCEEESHSNFAYLQR